MVISEEIDRKIITEAITELWEPLNDRQREFLTDSIEIHTFNRNEVIFCENEVPRFLMCLISGKVKIYMDGIGGRDQIIRLINQKDFSDTGPPLRVKTTATELPHSNLL